MIVDSIRKLAGQAIVAGFPAGDPPGELLEAAARGELGGFILFRRNLGPPPAVVELTRRLISAFPADLPPFLGVDQEGGRVQRLGPPILQLPPMRDLGAFDRPELTEEAGACLGAQLAAFGFNVDFAPVLDVDTHPDSPIIGDRSFGAVPERVARHGGAFARGLQGAGVAACGKHFPGHGDAALDSHLALPRVTHGRGRLDAVELAPFKALSSTLATMMTAHIVFDALESGVPATLSRVAIEQVLRGEFGFGGVVFSDDLLMKAIADHYGVPEAGCEAIAAGCDTLLVCDEPDLTLQVHEALVRRAEREPRFAERLRQSAARSLSVRRLYRPQPLRVEQLEARLAGAQAHAVQERLAHAPQADAPPERVRKG